MKSGKLRHRATLQQPNLAKNDNHETVPGWTDVQTVWCEILPTSGREFESSKKMTAEVTHTIRMRFMPSVMPTENMRFQFGSKYFNIVSAINVENRNIEMLCLCVETKT